MSFRKKIALNDEVREELEKSFSLFCLWVAENGLYDPEIDPVHNPDWRKTQENNEKHLLSLVKKREESLKNTWEALGDQK